MKRCCSFLPIVVLALLLTACGPYSDSQVVNAQAAQLSNITQIADPTPIPEMPAIRISPAPANSVVVQHTDPTLTAESIASTSPMPDEPPDNCPVTRSSDLPFTPPPPYLQNAPGDYFWYGSDSLWTAVPHNGVWSALPHNPEGYSQKVLWWRTGYSWTAEPEPQLSVIGRRLDATAPPLNVSRATNAFAEDIGSAMLVGVDFPTLGCWEIVGRYGDHELSFVVWVAR